MKKLLYLFLLSICAQSLAAQNYTLKTRTGDNAYKQMTIKMENGIAYVSQSDIAKDESLYPAIYDLAGLGLVDNTIAIPNDGDKYWYIYFDRPASGGPAPEERYTVICTCANSTDDGCHRLLTAYPAPSQIGCKNTGCNFCLLRKITKYSFRPGEEETKEEYTAPYVIVKANQVIFL